MSEHAHSAQVRFRDQQVTVSRHTFVFEGDSGVVFSRSQIPLRLAWALTVHRLQSLELDELIVDCNDMWDLALLYVPMTRVKSGQGLRFINLAKNFSALCQLAPPTKILSFQARLDQMQAGASAEAPSSSSSSLPSVPSPSSPPHPAAASASRSSSST